MFRWPLIRLSWDNIWKSLRQSKATAKTLKARIVPSVTLISILWCSSHDFLLTIFLIIFLEYNINELYRVNSPNFGCLINIGNGPHSGPPFYSKA